MHYADFICQTVEVLCNNPGVAEQPTTTARVRVGKWDARCWRVQLSELEFIVNAQWFPPTFGPPTNIRARITWGVDSVLHVADCDWPAVGGSFVVSGDFVQVDLVVPPQFATSPPDPNALQTAIRGGATIVPDSGAASGTPTRTIRTIDMVPFDFDILTIPSYARSFRWHQLAFTDPAVTASLVAFYGSQESTGFISSQTTVFAPLTDSYTQSERSWPGPAGITLSPLSRFLVVENRNPLFVLSLQIEFVLDMT